MTLKSLRALKSLIKNLKKTMQQQPQPTPSIFPKASGNYRKLISFQKAEAIFDITYFFCNKYLRYGDRTYDQMVQAARSGKQNIVEGCAASATSKETEIKLVNVAKASSLELLSDYEDYLRTRGHRQWEMGSVEMNAMRRMGRQHNDSAFYMPLVRERPPETIANMAIVLIKQNDYMLFHQLHTLEQEFLQQGGMRERMFKARVEWRNEQKQQM
jgi:four helix bundle suffix protein